MSDEGHNDLPAVGGEQPAKESLAQPELAPAPLGLVPPRDDAIFQDDLLDLKESPAAAPPAAAGGIGDFSALWPADGTKRRSVDDILQEVGRRGGPTEHGWHTRQAQFYCAREAAFNARAGEVNEDRMSLSVGSITHEYLAEHYACHMEGRPLGDALAKMERTHALLCEHGHTDAANEARRLYVGYRVKYEHEDEYVRRGKVIGVEKKLYRQLPWGDMYTVRADVVVECPDGILIVDHKTSTKDDSEFREGWAVDPGMLGLEWASSKFYKPIIGYSINGLIKTATPKYARMFFAASQRLVRDWLAMLRYRHLERQIAAIAGNPPNFSQCLRRYGKCAWFTECVYGMKPERNRSDE
jgi:hypothetical protein